MKVHNILEEVVIKSVNEMYEHLKETKTPWLTCDCEHCKLDVTSYVLNRIPPKYIVSGRGAAYSSSENDSQQNADIEALVIKAIQIVSSVQRPYHNKNENNSNIGKGPTFNFPTFFGTIYDGNTFEPLSNVNVLLKCNNVEAEMLDYTWVNPCVTNQHSKSAYTFLVKPEDSKIEGENKVFSFTIEATADGYEKLIYNFSYPVISSEKPNLVLNSTYALKIQDLFMFPKN